MLKVKFRFAEGHRDAYVHLPPWRLEILFLNLTEHCNLSCEYCYSQFPRPMNTMPLALVGSILDQAAENGVHTIILTGGEPFLHPDFPTILGQCAERELVCKIATNGTRLDERHVDMLLEHRVRSLQISLDTLDPVLYSRIKGVGPEVHRAVLDGIARCRDTGLLHLALSTVFRDGRNRHLLDLLTFCHDQGLATFTLYNLVPYGRAARRCVRNEGAFVEATHELLGAFRRLPRHWAVDVGLPWALDSDLIDRWKPHLDIEPRGSCIAGKTSLTIQADGEAVPCYCMNDHTFSCGNLGRDSLKDVWQAENLKYFRGEKPIEGCGSCTRWGTCLGGCRLVGYARTGRHDGADALCAHWACSRDPRARPSSAV